MSEVEGAAVGAAEHGHSADQKYTRNNPYYSTVVKNYLLTRRRTPRRRRGILRSRWKRG